MTERGSECQYTATARIRTSILCGVFSRFISHMASPPYQTSFVRCLRDSLVMWRRHRHTTHPSPCEVLLQRAVASTMPPAAGRRGGRGRGRGGRRGGSRNDVASPARTIGVRGAATATVAALGGSLAICDVDAEAVPTTDAEAATSPAPTIAAPGPEVAPAARRGPEAADASVIGTTKNVNHAMMS